MRGITSGWGKYLHIIIYIPKAFSLRRLLSVVRLLEMATGTNDASAVTDPELWKEQQRFYNFLQHYDLHKYHQRFLRMGVTRISHFKDVSDPDLDAVGLSAPEKTRLRKKLDQNFSARGKLKVCVRFRPGERFNTVVLVLQRANELSAS